MRIALFLFIFSFSAFSQTRYTVKGFFTEPGKTVPVSYALNWIETGAELKGLYKDTSIKESIPVTILRNDQMRIIQVPLEKSLILMTTLPDQSSAAKNISVSVTIADQNKHLIAATLAEADFTQTLAQAEEERPAQVAVKQTPCNEGFGGLSGYCGTYQGMVVEEQDTANKCALTAQSIPRLIFNDLGEIGIRVGATSSITPNPIHMVGRIPLNDSRSTVDIMSRVCRPLDGTTFNGDDCKRINVTGDFSKTLSNNAHFFGTYVIVDEKTNERCQYRFSMDKT